MARPAIMENTTRMDMRLPQALVDQIDKWRGVQPGVPSRCDAVRRVLVKGLDAFRAEAEGKVVGQRTENCGPTT